MLYLILLIVAVVPPPQEPTGWEALLRLLRTADDVQLQADLLAGIADGLEGRRNVAQPATWPATYASLMQSDSLEVRDRAIQLALKFGDETALTTLRRQAEDIRQSPAARNRALQLLIKKRPRQLEPLLLKMVDDSVTRDRALQGLAAYNHRDTVRVILENYPGFNAASRQNALQTLAARPSWARALLSAIDRKQIPSSDLTAFTVRQLHSLGDKELTARLKTVWGEVRATAADKRRLIKRYKQQLGPAALAEGDMASGRALFQKHCASCHLLFGEGGKIGPDITGAQRKNLEYLLENLVDPSATVAKDYQMEIVATTEGRIITGLVVAEDERSVTLQTVNEKLVVPKNEIEQRKQSPASMMPDGLLQKLSKAELRDLMRYLMQ